MKHASKVAPIVEAWDKFVAASVATWRHVEAEGHYTGNGYRREQPCADPDEHHRLQFVEDNAWAAYREAGGS